MTIIFWLVVFLILYSYLFYPLLLKLLVQVKPLKMSTPEPLPKVAVIISAYNEESCILARIENLLKQDYAGDMQFLIGSDGSSDNTAKIITSVNNPRLNAHVFTTNRGKMTVLNDLVSKVDSDVQVLVFSDANTEFSDNAISILIDSFDEHVGAVSGELILQAEQGNQNEDGLYWRYEQQIKLHESQLGCLLGANGAIYAVRKNLYIPLPADTIVDDFCIVMNVKKQGYQVVYNPKATAIEEVAPSLRDEYGRRVRIGLGNYKALFANLWALKPSDPLFTWCFISHKILRWFVPHFLVIALLANITLVTEGFYLMTGLLQVLVYGVAYMGIKAINEKKTVTPIISIVSFFVLMNIALGHGFIKFCRGGHQGLWQRTARKGETFK